MDNNTLRFSKAKLFFSAIIGLLLVSCEGQQETSDDPQPQVLGLSAKDSSLAFTSETAPQTVKAEATDAPKQEAVNETIAPVDFSVPVGVLDVDLSQLPTEQNENQQEQEAALPVVDIQTADTVQQQMPDFLGTTTRQDIALQSYAAQERLLDTPDKVGYRTGGVIASSGDFSLYGAREREEHPNMLTAQRLNITASYTHGALSANVGTMVNKYYALGLTTQYGVHGSMTYRFSPNVSATIFGEYYNKNPYVYMAAFPFINTSRYGGYVTLRGKNVGTHLGAERYYDPFVKHWELRPIVTPFVRVSKKVTIELPLGGLLKEGTDRLFHVRRNRGPIIMPTIY